MEPKEKTGIELIAEDQAEQLASNLNSLQALKASLSASERFRKEDAMSHINEANELRASLQAAREELKQIKKGIAHMRQQAAKDIEKGKAEYDATDDEDEKDQIVRGMAAPEYIVNLLDLKFPELKSKSNGK